MSNIERCPTCGTACMIEGTVTRYFVPAEPAELCGIADLERQLAGAKAEIEPLRKYFFMHENCRLGTGLCKRAQEADAALLASVDLLDEKRAEMERRLDEGTKQLSGCEVRYGGLLAEIEAMRPVVEAVGLFKAGGWIATGDVTITVKQHLLDTYRDYESRKKT